MVYDRYIAICQPPHYETVMNRRVCVQMAASAWTNVLLYSAVHTGKTFAISFCGGNMVDQFFCEVPQLPFVFRTLTINQVLERRTLLIKKKVKESHLQNQDGR
ncbi:unnamed protein product [Natator depressus]